MAVHVALRHLAPGSEGEAQETAAHPAALAVSSAQQLRGGGARGRRRHLPSANPLSFPREGESAAREATAAAAALLPTPPLPPLLFLLFLPFLSRLYEERKQLLPCSRGKPTPPPRAAPGPRARAGSARRRTTSCSFTSIPPSRSIQETFLSALLCLFGSLCRPVPLAPPPLLSSLLPYFPSLCQFARLRNFVFSWGNGGGAYLIPHLASFSTPSLVLCASHLNPLSLFFGFELCQDVFQRAPF